VQGVEAGLIIRYANQAEDEAAYATLQGVVSTSVGGGVATGGVGGGVAAGPGVDLTGTVGLAPGGPSFPPGGVGSGTAEGNAVTGGKVALVPWGGGALVPQPVPSSLSGGGLTKHQFRALGDDESKG